MEHIVGHITWAPLARRAASGILHITYTFIHSLLGKSQGILWDSVSRELGWIQSLLLTFVALLDLPWITRLTCSYSSHPGLGAIERDIDEQLVGDPGRQSATSMIWEMMFWNTWAIPLLMTYQNASLRGEIGQPSTAAGGSSRRTLYVLRLGRSHGVCAGFAGLTDSIVNNCCFSSTHQHLLSQRFELSTCTFYLPLDILQLIVLLPGVEIAPALIASKTTLLTNQAECSPTLGPANDLLAPRPTT